MPRLPTRKLKPLYTSCFGEHCPSHSRWVEGAVCGLAKLTAWRSGQLNQAHSLPCSLPIHITVQEH